MVNLDHSGEAVNYF